MTRRVPTLAVLLLGTPALAAEGDRGGRWIEWERSRPDRTGFEVEMAGTAGGCVGELCGGDGPLGPGVGFAIGFGYRFLPFVGLTLVLQHNLLSDDASGSEETSYTLLGLQARFYLLREGDFTGWAGAGAGLVGWGMYTTVEHCIEDDDGYCSDANPLEEEIGAEWHGKFAALVVGGDYRFAATLSVGLSLQYAAAFFREYCDRSDLEGDECRAVAQGPIDPGALPSFWATYLTVRWYD